MEEQCNMVTKRIWGNCTACHTEATERAYNMTTHMVQGRQRARGGGQCKMVIQRAAVEHGHIEGKGNSVDWSHREYGETSLGWSHRGHGGSIALPYREY